MQQPDLMKPAEAAAMLAISKSALALDRRREKPTYPFARLSPRSVRYSRAALQRLIDAHTVGGGVQP